jgi:molecular chaperone GrpE
MPNSPASEGRPEGTAQAPEQQPDGGGGPDLNDELAQMEDRFKRAVADLDNYRKRAARELERMVAERSDAALLEWLEVVDTVDRALAQRPENPLRDALRALLDQMESILARAGVTRVGEPGEPFDPNRHEAVEVRETDEAPDRTVVEVLRSGYARGDRILRPAQVVVARAPQHQQQP